MPTQTIRTVSLAIVDSWEALGRRHNRSMEREVLDILEGDVPERRSVLAQIEGGWSKQARRPDSREADAGITAGRS